MGSLPGLSLHLQRPLSSPSSSALLSCFSIQTYWSSSISLYNRSCDSPSSKCSFPILTLHHRGTRRPLVGLVLVGTEETEVSFGNESTAAEEEQQDPTPEDLEYVSQIKRVLELLRKNRDMLFGEVKLTVMIEDPREVERRRLLGIDDSEAPSREDLVAALEDVNEGRIPEDRYALRMLAEELINWPNLEVEIPRERPKSRSPYAKATDTGIDPKVAAKRLNMDWDSAAEIEDIEVTDDAEVPPVLGYGALYLVSAFPVIIGVSVVLILFYNSLQ